LEITMPTSLDLAPLDTQQEAARVRSLEALLAALKTFTAQGDEGRVEFSALFGRAQRILELDDLTLAGIFQVSRPTIGRWARGLTAPHPLGQEPVFRALAGLTAGRLALHRSKPLHRPGLDLKLRATRASVVAEEDRTTRMLT
jgi:hypothetical protein